MKIEQCFQLGYIIKPHGIRGELSIFLDTDNPEYYAEVESVFVEYQQKLIPFFIDHFQLLGTRATVKFNGIDDIETALSYKGCALYLPLDLLPALEDDQFYYHEIVGFAVEDQHRGAIGKVTSVYEGSGNDLFVIDCSGREVLVPIRDELIVNVDKQARKLSLALPEGLLDIYL